LSSHEFIDVRFEHWLVGEYVEQLGIGVAGETLRLDRGDGGRDLEHLRCLGESDDVVLQRLAVDGLHAERHLRLVVDEDDLRVLWCKDFELRIGHG
jgi:hypothetical protein